MLTLARAIINEDIGSVKQLLRYGDYINLIDEYGFRPLIQAAIMDNIEIAKLLLQAGANPNLQDVTGGTALHWIAENNNHAFAKLLLEHGADPNAYNLAGQPVLVMPMLRQQRKMRQQLIQAGADQVFAQDFINTKLLGHMFELIGAGSIVSPKNEFVEVSFEGFYLEVTIDMIANSLHEFLNHFAARSLRQFYKLGNFIMQLLQRAAQLAKYQHYRLDINQHRVNIDLLLEHDPLIIPVGYEGHAITFIRYQDLWVKCDRREGTRLYDNVMIYRMQNPDFLSNDVLKYMMYTKQNSQFINVELDNLLGLQSLTELKVEAQTTGNCSWANVEATIPAVFFLILFKNTNDQRAIPTYKNIALQYFERWRTWNKERSLQFCLQAYETGDALRKATKAEILAAVLFKLCSAKEITQPKQIETLLQLLINSPYAYILQNYLRIYYYEHYTDEGKRFADLLRESGYLKR